MHRDKAADTISIEAAVLLVEDISVLCHDPLSCCLEIIP